MCDARAGGEAQTNKRTVSEESLSSEEGDVAGELEEVCWDPLS